MILRKLRAAWRHLVVRPLRVRQFGGFGRRSLVLSPLQIDGGRNIRIGRGTVVEKGAWLAAVPLTGAKQCRLEIGDGCAIGHLNHIYCTGSIVIEDEVLTADKVYISDNLHSYTDIGTPILRQPVKQLNPVTIGAGAWLGENVCVIGASVGRGSVIGANSVVTKNIPDYCVAVGVPARVIKRYNPQTERWESGGC